MLKCNFRHCSDETISELTLWDMLSMMQSAWEPDLLVNVTWYEHQATVNKGFDKPLAWGATMSNWSQYDVSTTSCSGQVDTTLKQYVTEEFIRPRKTVNDMTLNPDEVLITKCERPETPTFKQNSALWLISICASSWRSTKRGIGGEASIF
jgi:hypothetical protein